MSTGKHDAQDHYNALARWAESDAPTIRPGTPLLRGAAAQAASRALLEAATEDDPENQSA